MAEISATSPTLHSVVEPAGVHAQHIDVVWTAMVWVCGFMYVLVLGFLAYSLLRHRGAARAAGDHHRALSKVLVGWTALMVAGLFGLTLTSFVTDRALVRAAAQPTVKIKITAHQWWWEVEYSDPDPHRRVRTANELHMPINSQVQIELSSNDVIHSFWVPSLHGKQDLIPGRTNEIRLQPLQPGVFRGLCAEYCGYQHAHMAFDVVVESEQDYRNWYEQQLAVANAPDDDLKQRGQFAFMAGPCVMCHAISGTQASASVGPDLSHVASRRMLAAGAIDNTPQNLRKWLEDPQSIKPGSHMPTMQLSADELDALVAYLGSLQ